MSELLLDSLEIKGYRCFEHLTIEKLGRVNLIVGKNNVGKTALLEALKIWADVDIWGKAKDVLDEILYLRNEKSVQPRTSSSSPADNFSYRHVLFGRPNIENGNDKILSFSIKAHTDFFLPEVVEIKINISRHGTSLNSEGNTHNDEIHSEIRNLYSSTRGLDEKLAVQIWDDILIQNEEDEAIKTLKILLDKISDLDFINYPKGSKQRVPVVRVEGLKERVPLKTFGEGMIRLLKISLALFYCRNGILLLDEIENGLHYSALPEVWQMIFRIAKNLNVQVFATTHSKDCVEAFAAAAVESPEDGMLIRLERQGERIIAKTIAEERLAQAMDYEVEVR